MKYYCENCGKEIIKGDDGYIHLILWPLYKKACYPADLDDNSSSGVAKFDVERFREEQLNKILSYGK